MKIFAISEIRTLNIFSCSTIVILKISDVHWSSIESNAVGIESLSRSCDLKVEDKAGYIITISCEFTEDNYVNYLDKTLEEIRLKDQHFNKTTEKILRIIQIMVSINPNLCHSNIRGYIIFITP
jgi:hypothetical protein